MFHMMKPAEARLNDFTEGFGIVAESSITIDHNKLDAAPPIAAGDFVTVGFTPFVGLFRQSKYLPIRYCPIQLELEIVNLSNEAVIGNLTPPTANDRSESFLIENVQLKCDLVDLDNSIDNEYTAYLMEGKILPIQYTGVSTGSQIFRDMKTDIHVSRSLSRLKAVFMTMLYTDLTAATFRGSEIMERFWHPMAGTFDSDKEVELQIQIGSKLYPEYPIRSLSEAFYQLRKTLGLHFGNDSLNIHRFCYYTNAFVAAIDLEKVLGASFSGMNTMSGDLLTIRMKSANGTITLDPNLSYSMFYTLVFDNILEISLTNCRVLE